MPHFSRRSKLRVDSKENAVVKAAHVPEQWEPIFRQGVLSENYIRTGPAPHGDHYRQTLFQCAIDYCAGRPTIWRRGTTPLASQRDDQLPCHPAISVLTRSGARKLTTQPHVAIAMVTLFDVSTAEACHAKVTAEGSRVSLFASCEQPTAFESLPRQQAWPRTKFGTRLISAEARDAKLHQLCHRRTAIEASNGQAITSRRRYR